MMPEKPELSPQPLPPVPTGRSNTVILFGEVLADVFPSQTVIGGAPFNVARHLKGFAQNPILITRLGEDSLREKILETMNEAEMNTMGVQFSHKYPTGQVRVHIKDGAHRFEILPMQAYDFIHPAVARMTALSVHPTLVYFGSLAQRHESSMKALKTLLRDNCAPTFLDINLREPWYDEKTLRQSLVYANIVKLNTDEIAVLAEIFELPGSDPLTQIKTLIKQFDISRALVTCGEKGAWQISREGQKIEVKVKNKIVQLVDTVGAGDGFAAVCILGSLRHWPITQTLERANSFAAAICEIRGAVPEHADFYRPFSKAWRI